MIQIGDYETDSNDAICPNCNYREYQEMCDLPRDIKDGDSFDWICQKCNLKCKLIFCEKYCWITETLETKGD